MARVVPECGKTPDSQTTSQGVIDSSQPVQPVYETGGPLERNLFSYDHANGLPWWDVATSHGLDMESHNRASINANQARWIATLWSSLCIAFENICTRDAALGCVITTACTCTYWYWGTTYVTKMNWTIVSLAVVFPVTQGIGMGFKRREQALGELGNLMGNLTQVWGAAYTWLVKSPQGGWVRVIDLYPEDDKAKQHLRHLFEEFLAALIMFIDTPRITAVHLARCSTQDNYGSEVEIKDISESHRLRVANCIASMQRMIQDLKTKGLPGGEAHRLDQYVSKVSIAFVRITFLKEYRTPIAFRSFARVCILMIGALYGPDFVYLGNDNNLRLPLAFGIVIQLAVSSLFAVMLGLEDPFLRHGGRGKHDSVKVAEIAEKARCQMVLMAENSAKEWSDRSSRKHFYSKSN